MFRARDVMTTHVVCVSHLAPVEEALALLLRHHVSGLPVVDADGRLVGILSEYDLLKLVEDPAAENLTVGELMTAEVVSVNEDTPLVEVADLLSRRGIRRLPVVRQGQLVGLLSRRDLIRHVRDLRSRVRSHRPAATAARS